MYKVELTDWERDALLEIINNGQYKGADIEAVTILKEKIKNTEKVEEKK